MMQLAPCLGPPQAIPIPEGQPVPENPVPGEPIPGVLPAPVIPIPGGPAPVGPVAGAGGAPAVMVVF